MPSLSLSFLWDCKGFCAGYRVLSRASALTAHSPADTAEPAGPRAPSPPTSVSLDGESTLQAPKFKLANWHMRKRERRDLGKGKCCFRCSAHQRPWSDRKWTGRDLCLRLRTLHRREQTRSLVRGLLLPNQGRRRETAELWEIHHSSWLHRGPQRTMSPCTASRPGR